MTIRCRFISAVACRPERTTSACRATVSAAALRLRIAQPALSRQIAALEDELGLKLFDRTRGRLLLTAEGEALLGDCRTLLKQASSLGERAQLLKHGETGTLRVAASPQFIEGVIVFVILWSLRKRDLPPGTMAWLYLVLAGLSRFVVEFWRINPALALGLSEAQWFSLALMVLGLALLVRRPKSVIVATSKAIGQPKSR